MNKEQYYKIASDWNGEDSVFFSEGTKYTNQQAITAGDIVDLMDNIENQEKDLARLKVELIADEEKLEKLKEEFKF